MGRPADLTADDPGRNRQGTVVRGLRLDAATGWPGTDWVEDLVLRQSGTEMYDQWVSARDPVHRPADQVDAFDDGRRDPPRTRSTSTPASATSTPSTTTPFGDPARALVDGDCVLHHQASFYDGFITDAGTATRRWTGRRHLGVHHAPVEADGEPAPSPAVARSSPRSRTTPRHREGAGVPLQPRVGEQPRRARWCDQRQQGPRPVERRRAPSCRRRSRSCRTRTPRSASTPPT